LLIIRCIDENNATLTELEAGLMQRILSWWSYASL